MNNLRLRSAMAAFAVGAAVTLGAGSAQAIVWDLSGGVPTTWHRGRNQPQLHRGRNNNHRGGIYEQLDSAQPRPYSKKIKVPAKPGSA